MRNRSVVPLLVSCSVLMAPALAQGQPANQAKVEQLLEAGGAAFDRGDFKDAARQLAEAEKASRGTSIVAVQGQAAAHLALKNFNDAEECAERFVALAKDPFDKASAENMLGSALVGAFREKRLHSPDDELLERAVTSFRNATGLAPNHLPIAWFNLSMALEYQLQWDDAIQAMQNFLLNDPGNDRALAHLCWQQYSDGAKPPPGVPTFKALKEAASKGQELKQPVRLYTPQPKYTEAAQDKELEGTIGIQMVLTETGHPTYPQPSQELDLGLTEQAVSTVCRWRFEPAQVDDEPRSILYTVTVSFRLDD